MADRVLVVEDDKTLAKLLAKKIAEALECEVDIAFSLQETKLFTKKYGYFVAITDLNLPDSSNGEIVDYLEEKGIVSIIFSASNDKQLKNRFLQKKVIDFIQKNSIEEINYLISLIQRIQKNRKHKVLVVDDSMVFRRQMQSYLELLCFEVFTVAHGEEALGMLQTYPDIKIVITDYNMPVMDGLTLTKEIRKSHSKNELSIIAISGNQDQEQIPMFLKAGANDYLFKSFSKEEFTCRLNNTIEALENIEMITHNSVRDFLTGTYNRRYFFAEASRYFDEAKANGNAIGIAIIDIDNFKKINDTFGHQTGDKVIVSLSQVLTTSADFNDMVARFGGGEFCILFRDTSKEQMIAKCEMVRQKVASIQIENGADTLNYQISIGLALGMEDSFDDMINTADMLLYNAKNSNQLNYR